MFKFTRSVFASLIAGLATLVLTVVGANAAPLSGAAAVERAIQAPSTTAGQTTLTPVHYRRHYRNRYRPYRRYRRYRRYRGYYPAYGRRYYRRRYYRPRYRSYVRPRYYGYRRWRRRW